jgi:PAS domain S-box-containing protein
MKTNPSALKKTGAEAVRGLARGKTAPRRGGQAINRERGEVVSLYDHAEVVLFGVVVEARGQFRFACVNRAFLRRAGLKAKEVVSKLVREVIPEPACSLMLKHCRQAVRTKATVTWMESSVYPSGTRYGEVAVTPVMDAQGRVTHLAGVVHDVTERKNAEDALRESAARFRQTLTHSPVVVWNQDKQLRYTWFYNPDPRLNVDAILGKTDKDLVPPDEARRLIRMKRRVLNTGVAAREEVTSTVGGEVRYHELTVEPLKDDRGRISGVGCVAVDITDRRSMDDALRRAKALLRGAFDNAPFEFWARDHEGKCILQNALHVRHRGNLVGTKTEESPIGSEDRKIWISNNRRALAGEIVQREVEYEEGGEPRWYHSVVAPFRVGEKIQGIVGFNIDITARKQAEAGYGREVDFLETLVNHTSSLIVLLDPEGHIVRINEPALALLGYDRKELLGRKPWEVGIMSSDEMARSKDRLQRLLAGKVNAPRETYLRAKDGSAHLVALSSVTTRMPDGRVDRIIVTGEDLTERSRLQKEVLRIAEQEQARIGHNLHDGVGQTLTGIAGLLDALEGELDSAHQSSVSRIRQLVKDAIAEVRGLSHGLSPAAVRNRGLCGALQLLADTVRLNHRIECVCEVESGGWIEDPEKEMHLFRIAQEAVNNAVRHGRPTRIKILLRRQESGEGLLQIEDNGSGFAKPRKTAGNGIGLQVMDYRANLIGALLEVSTKAKKGVTVTCRFSPCNGFPAMAETAAGKQGKGAAKSSQEWDQGPQI